MSEDGEMWEAIRKRGQAKKRSNLAYSTELLKQKGVAFQIFNNGVHLFVEGRFDFWPSTGKFIERATQKKGRGVKSLLKILEK